MKGELEEEDAFSITRLQALGQIRGKQLLSQRSAESWGQGWARRETLSETQPREGPDILDSGIILEKGLRQPSSEILGPP